VKKSSRIGLAILSSAMLACLSCSQRQNPCDAVDAIARDAKKMAYVREWITSRLANQKFLESVGTRHTFTYGDERVGEFGVVDWKYLGFANELASLRFNMDTTESGKWDSTRIDSVSLQQGRVAIIIRLSSAEDFQSAWPPEALEKMHSVADDVLVYCDE
jgi:hypothetical protein